MIFLKIVLQLLGLFYLHVVIFFSFFFSDYFELMSEVISHSMDIKNGHIYFVLYSYYILVTQKMLEDFELHINENRNISQTSSLYVLYTCR